MGKILSEAGEIEFEVKSLRRDGDNLVAVGTMGVWQSKVYLFPEEIMRLVVTVLSTPAILLFTISLPIILLKRRFRRRERS